MPVFNLKCSACWTPRKAIRPPGWNFSEDKWLRCDNCGASGTMVRDPVPPTTLVKEVLDNGARVKALERLADAERLHKDRVEVEDALARGKDPGRTIR